MKENAPALLHVMMEVEHAHEEEFNRWYWEEHVPERLAIPGFLSARRFVAKMGSPKYLAIYELENADVLKSAAYEYALSNPTPWTRKMGKHYRSTRHLYSEIFRPQEDDQ